MNKKIKHQSESIQETLPLDCIKVSFADDIAYEAYPFSLKIIQNLKTITFTSQVTFFIGENGTGKSTILEAIANKVGFGPEGGSKNIAFKTSEERTYTSIEKLAEQFTLSWRYKPKNGYFFRAESFFNLANHLDTIARYGGGGPEITFAAYGGKSLHMQSHGESFMALFKNRLGDGGFFILDEPEAALSPQQQLSLMVVIHEICSHHRAQFLIATHSPILLGYPNATIYSCDSQKLQPVAYTDTEHYQITKNFLNNTDNFLYHLFGNDSENED